MVELRLNLGAWVDYSDSVNITNFKRTISLNGTNDPQKNQGGDISVFGPAYTFVKSNLIDSPNLYSNAVYVRFTDSLCSGTVYVFKVETENLRWCDNMSCELSFDMEEYNPQIECIKQKTIADNTNGEFQEYPTSGFPHPRFRYCDVIKPTAFFGVMVTIFNLLDSMIASFNVSIIALNLVIGIVGGTPVPTIPYVFTRWAGCGLGFPAPFIRTYIQNVCTLCGLTPEDPIHFSLIDPLNALRSNDYYNACLLTAPTTKGVLMSGNRGYIVNNQPSWTLDELASKMKDFWNARYFIHNNKFFFHRKDMIGDLIWGGGTVHIDFTSQADSDALIDSVCYEWNGDGKVRRINMNYGIDPSDSIGNELKRRFSGEYNETSPNPNYKEVKEINTYDFGAASFVLDGKDTVYDVNIVNSIGVVMSGFDYGGVLKTLGDTLGLAKILIFDETRSITKDAKTTLDTYATYQSTPDFVEDDGAFYPAALSDLGYYNWPMSFDTFANAIRPNLFEYHKIDIADPSKRTNIAFSFNLEYCCRFNSLNLYQKVRFKDGVTYGEINFIEYDYESRQIKVKGNLI